ncbi:HAD-IIA family hydrolase [Corynebacterium sp. HS2168-gen11]|uniref:HAD-IIA family hydrolase n=1 Tax=Corynebacterium sp. HS2168-gen11 TaxID=2974027 RepID=UPI00216B24B6|nr:HAD-IIA family hydrolase [Corynebacterium sp. HS2168-gen11]MCS4535023.1 HAD-IIA family hydrolase [Corynebacterium sp. HS2168-gen11]
MTLSAFSTYDSLLFDLDGTVWEGGRLLPFAQEVITNAPVPVMYITNNASRHPDVVAQMLTDMGIPTSSGQVVTSAQTAVEFATEQFPEGGNIYVLGTQSFKDLATAAGFTVVESADDEPVVVLHGHNPETGWAQLSEAALSIRKGARYFASNLDSTLPMERGFMVGNGSMVAAVSHATGVVPQAAGKPEPAMFYSAIKKLGATNALAIGDRLNTDIAGGVAAGLDSLHLLTGVSKHWELLRAPAAHRPTYIATSLQDLTTPLEVLRPQTQGGFEVSFDGDDIVVDGGDTSATAVELLRSVLVYAWQSPESYTGEIRCVSSVSQQLLQQWV